MCVCVCLFTNFTWCISTFSSFVYVKKGVRRDPQAVLLQKVHRKRCHKNCHFHQARIGEKRSNIAPSTDSRRTFRDNGCFPSTLVTQKYLRFLAFPTSGALLPFTSSSELHVLPLSYMAMLNIANRGFFLQCAVTLPRHTKSLTISLFVKTRLKSTNQQREYIRSFASHAPLSCSLYLSTARSHARNRMSMGFLFSLSSYISWNNLDISVLQ